MGYTRKDRIIAGLKRCRERYNNGSSNVCEKCPFHGHQYPCMDEMFSKAIEYIRMSDTTTNMTRTRTTAASAGGECFGVTGAALAAESRSTGARWTMSRKRSSSSKTRSLNGRKIEAMHRYYGIDPGGGICADCQHLRRCEAGNHKVYKCVLYGDTASEASDWRLKWQACMLIDHDPEIEGWVPVMERIQHEPRRHRELPLEGQISMEEAINEATDQA